HNRHWRVLFLDETYWLQPPVETDPEQTLIALPSKNPLMQPPPLHDALEAKARAAATADRSALGHGGFDRLDQRNGGAPKTGARPSDGGFDGIAPRQDDEPLEDYPHHDYRN
ncbi:hypothetical protein, partial [Cryobacterium sp. TMT1-2-2]|uniref:hypothetical protein n=1 Tax=Cryobacterium sp. TMT1-2-2 TaxID=1259233 RepID=UPI00141B07DD